MPRYVDFVEDDEPFEPDYDQSEIDEGCDFADPGGNSALRAATSSNPRNLPCPNCRQPNRLTPADKVPVTTEPECGCAIVRKGKLVFITDGAIWIEGRLSNHFHWRVVKPDGTLGRSYSGYWY